MSDHRCPECEGIGWVTYGSHSIDSEPCRTCAGRGRVEECPGPDASWSGVDQAPLDNAAKVWRCDVCGAEGVANYLSQQRNHLPPSAASQGVEPQ